MIRIGHTAVLAVVVAAWAGTAAAGKATVVKATASQGAGGVYSFSTTVAHADTGWKHYADKFEVLAPDGAVLGTRILVHPRPRQRQNPGRHHQRHRPRL